jgi:acyl transferase domain-containing protein
MMTVDLTQALQFGALGVLALVLVGVGYGVRLWATQSAALTERVIAVVEANSKVISQNTSATDAIHTSLEGVRADVRGLSMQIASQPCQAEEIAERMVEEMRQVKDKPPPGPA